METVASITATIATLVLAALTFALARSTNKMAEHTKRLADATVDLASETKKIATETQRAAAAASEAAQSAAHGVAIEVARREEELRADLLPTDWSGRAGVVVTNRGKGVAAEVRVWTWIAAGSQTMESKAVGVTLAAGESITGRDLQMDTCDYTGADKDLAARQDGVRTEWRNADDSEGGSGWVPYQRKN